MPDVSLPAPFDAYNGVHPYIFVSYAHKDASMVYPELKWLNSQDYRIWYDEGIDPGNEWPEEVARALASCSQFVVFLTSNACESKNVRNEINFALKRDIPFIAVYLSEVDLPLGLDLQIGSVQAIFKHKMCAESYQRKVAKAIQPTLKRNDRIDAERFRIRSLQEIRRLATVLPKGAKLQVTLKTGKAITMVFSYPQNMVLPEGNFFIYGELSDGSTALKLEDIEELVFDEKA